MEVIKEVLIKVVGGTFHDKVFIVENLPKKMLFDRTVRQVQRFDKDGYADGTLTVDPEREMEDTLYTGLEYSPTGDNGIVFWTETNEGKERLAAIDRYIDQSMPRDARVEKRVSYAQQEGSPNSPPKYLSQLPRVQLPLNPNDVQVPLPQKQPIKIPNRHGITTQQYEETKKEVPLNLRPMDEYKTKPIDKRKMGWSDERRQASRERIMKLHEARRNAAGAV